MAQDPLSHTIRASRHSLLVKNEPEPSTSGRNRFKRFKLPRYNKNFLHPGHFNVKPLGWTPSCPWPRNDSGRPVSMTDMLADEEVQQRAATRWAMRAHNQVLDWREVHPDHAARSPLFPDIPLLFVTKPNGELMGLKDPNKYLPPPRKLEKPRKITREGIINSVRNMRK